MTLLELSSSFGVEESRGTLLRASFSHQDIAELVGATRPRVTEHLAQLERDHLVVRQGRQMIIRATELREALLEQSSNNNSSNARIGARNKVRRIALDRSGRSPANEISSG